MSLKALRFGDFAGSSVANTLPSSAEGVGSIPAPRGKLPYALRPKYRTRNRSTFVTSSIKTSEFVGVHSVMSDSLQPHGPQHTRLLCPPLSPRVCPNSCPLSWWCPQASSSSLTSPSPPALNLSWHQGLFQWVSSSYQVAKVLELQHQSFQWIFRTDFL